MKPVKIAALKPQKPDVPAPFAAHVAWAIKALAAGNANEGQQKAALDWIITTCAATYELPYFESSRDTDFALGKMHVGRQIVGIINMRPDLLTEMKPNE